MRAGPFVDTCWLRLEHPDSRDNAAGRPWVVMKPSGLGVTLRPGRLNSRWRRAEAFLNFLTDAHERPQVTLNLRNRRFPAGRNPAATLCQGRTRPLAITPKV